MRRPATLIVVTAAAAGLAFPQAKQPKVKSRGEGQAVNAMLQAPDPASRIKAADDLLSKYADTEFKSYALYLEADAYSQSNDTAKTIVYGEQALDADAKNYNAAVLLAKTYAGTTKSTDLDKAEKLTKISKYANDAIEALKTADKPNPKMTDPEWAKIKDDFSGQCYYALGVVAVYNNKLDDAKQDFQKVADMDTDPTDLIRAGRALLDAKKYEAAVEWFDKAAAAPNANDAIKRIAAADKARAQAMIKK